MATQSQETVFGIGTGVGDTLSALRSALSSAIAALLVSAASLVWFAIWLSVVRLHMAAGDLFSTALTLVVFVLPLVAGLGVYLRGRVREARRAVSAA